MSLSVFVTLPQINDTQIDNVRDALVALSEDIDPVVLTLSRSAAHLSSPINSNTNPNSSNSGKSMRSSAESNQPNSSKNFHASNSSIKSDKSDPSSHMQRSRGGSGGKSSSGAGVFRDIFRVRLPGKKYSSPEEATLATLDSAIASGGGGGGVGGSTAASGGNLSSHIRSKSRKKRSSAQRNSATENSLNKNGTWPRIRNSSCSYTLPQGVPTEQGNRVSGTGTNTISGPNSLAGSGHHGREMSFYGQYTPHNNSSGITLSNASNSMCLRRSGGAKERAPISNLVWDLGNVPHPAKSVGAIQMSGMGGGGAGGGINVNSKSLTLAGPGRPGITSLALDNHGLPLASSVAQAPHHRYSLFDPTSNSNKIVKG